MLLVVCSLFPLQCVKFIPHLSDKTVLSIPGRAYENLHCHTLISALTSFKLAQGQGIRHAVRNEAGQAPYWDEDQGTLGNASPCFPPYTTGALYTAAIAAQEPVNSTPDILLHNINLSSAQTSSTEPKFKGRRPQLQVPPLPPPAAEGWQRHAYAYTPGATSPRSTPCSMTSVVTSSYLLPTSLTPTPQVRRHHAAHLAQLPVLSLHPTYSQRPLRPAGSSFPEEARFTTSLSQTTKARRDLSPVKQRAMNFRAGINKTTGKFLHSGYLG